MPTIIETFEEWQARQGVVSWLHVKCDQGEVGLPMAKVGRRKWICPSGASVTDIGLNFLHRSEPPADEQARLTARREYHEAMERQAVKDFTDVKTISGGGGGIGGLPLRYQWPKGTYGPDPREYKSGHDAIRTALERLRSVVHHHRRAIEDIDRELTALEPQWHHDPQVVADLRAEEQAHAEAARLEAAEIANMTL